jgi:hypothetical protein
LLPTGRSHRLQFEPALGQLVHGGGCGWRQRAPHEYAGVLQIVEALREHVPTDSWEPAAQVGETFGAEQQLSNHQQRPAPADQVERMR